MHQFLRCDSLHKLTDADRNMLEEYGVAAVVDLRSSREVEQAPYVWKNSDSVAYYSVALLDQMNSSGFQGEFPKSMSELYIRLLEGNKKEFAEIFHIMSRYPEKCVAFNCTAGKDRTRVTAMLLLGLADIQNSNPGICASLRTGTNEKDAGIFERKVWFCKSVYEKHGGL